MKTPENGMNVVQLIGILKRYPGHFTVYIATPDSLDGFYAPVSIIAGGGSRIQFGGKDETTPKESVTIFPLAEGE